MKTFLQRKSNQGQAMIEFLVGVIGLGVVFLGIILIGDLSKARLKTLLDSRASAGDMAISGLSGGTPIYYGTAGSQDTLKSQVLDNLEDPIQYSVYSGSSYPYIEDNLTANVYNPSTDLISAFSFTVSENTQAVNNSPFLVNMGVGASVISIRQKTCLPLLKDFQ